MATGGDMIVRLYGLPEAPTPAGVKIKRAFPADRTAILQFIEENFTKGWADEAETALMRCPPGCYIAVADRRVVGFACWDATAKGFFGPIGVAKDLRGGQVGTALLLHTLHAMRADGYAYAVIGWVGDAETFYHKIVDAVYIPGGTPDNSVYVNMISR